MDRRKVTNFDWILLLLTLIIASTGVLTIYSATESGEGGLRAFYVRQAIWVLIGLTVMVVTLLFDYRTISRLAYPLYGFTILALIAVEAVGKTVSGSQRWLVLGPISFQPSELAKLSLILTLAKYFHDSKWSGLYRLRDLWLPALLTLIPMGLIIKQPDLGTGLVLFLVFLVMALVVGLRPRSILCLVLMGLVALPAGWFSLKDYQKGRILTLFNPEADPLGAGYHSLQSKIAIGSGGFWGKGLFAGTQSRLNFLPEKHTDFIFAVFSEQMGFIGAVVLLLIYLALLFRACDLAAKASDKLGTLIATGITVMIAFYIVFNMGMTLGLFPVVGIPLPLMSYGGSAMLTFMSGIGLLLNIRMRKFLY
ncbi:MAG: rod shape-determining protein RodA [Candidatus Tectomicrobia bacterium]|uniref:Peptidoglycan glycosyltransferase RodA n=1 Tax=Tectimicrobiota bacterium TaxID=2528274 RepID=A0A932CQL7_UNCTE|nr:rod shape-determining protein RodA [Candidatus Tectomicrobia bacterium]